MAGMGQQTGQSYRIAVSTITPCTFDYQDLGTEFLTSDPRTASQGPKAYGSFEDFNRILAAVLHNAQDLPGSRVN